MSATSRRRRRRRHPSVSGDDGVAPDEHQLRVVQNIIMKMYIADTNKEIWIGKSELFVSK